MFAVMGFLFVVLILLYLTFAVVANLLIGGEEFSPLLNSDTTSTYNKVIGVLMFVIVIALWAALGASL